MVRRKYSLSLSQTATEDEKSSAKGSGGFFANWFSVPSRTETRDDSEAEEFSESSESSDGYDSESQLRPRREKKKATLSESFETDDEQVSVDEESLQDFDRDLRTRHGQACKYMRTGKFTKALKKFEGILASILERFGENHHRVGAALHNVGIANLRAGKLTDAMDAIEEAVRIRKMTLGPDDPKVADSLVELGIVLLSLKEYSDSLEIFMEALELREAEADDMVLPEQIKEINLKIAKVLNNIGCVNFENARFEEAKEAFVDAIAMQKKSLGDVSAFSFNNPATKPGFLTMASTMCNKGYIELEKEEYKPAIYTFNESLKIQKMLLGADNKLVLSTLDNLGFAYAMNRSYDRALATYQQLLANQEKSYGETHVECGETLKKIVYLQLMTHNFEAALQTLCNLEDIQIESKGRASPDVSMTRKLMGHVNYQVLKYPTAGCGMFSCTGDDGDEEMNLANWVPVKPNNGSKMSGHRVTCA